MKNKLFVVWCLVYGLTEATRIQQLENIEMVSIGEKIQKINDKNMLSIGEKIHQIKERQFMQIEDGKLSAWDSNILGLVDFDSYNQETKSALEEQHVNIEFKNQEHFPMDEEKLFKKEQKPQKLVVVKKPVVVKKVVKVEKPKEEEESLEQKKLNEKFLSEEVRKTKIENSIVLRAAGEKEDVERSSPDFALAQAKKKLAKMKKHQHQLAKLEVMKSEKKVAEKKLDVLKEKQQEEVQTKVDEMNKVWEQFCTTFDLNTWQKAQEMWKKLDSEGANPELLKVDTKEIYEKAFSFAEIAKNDEVVSLLEPLEIAQKNLNMNSNNHLLIDKFIQVAKTSANELDEGFKMYWNNPSQ